MENQQNQAQELNSQQGKQEFIQANSINLGEMLTEPPTNVPVNLNTSTVATNEQANQPVKQETKSLDALSTNQVEIDQFYQDNLNKKWTFIDKISNRGMFNQVQEVKKDLFKASAHYRLAFYKTILDTRLEYLNEKCNAGIKMVKGHYRQQVATYLMSKMEQLSFEVRDRQFAFLEMMKGKYKYAESLTGYPSMHQRYMTSVFDEETKYLKFLDGLLDKFQSIVDEELKKYN